MRVLELSKGFLYNMIFLVLEIFCVSKIGPLSLVQNSIVLFLRTCDLGIKFLCIMYDLIPSF
jgi:hypothetical protein